MAKKKTYVLGSRRRLALAKLEVGQRFMAAYDNMRSANPRGGAAESLRKFKEVELEWCKINKYPEPLWVAQEKILAAQAARRAAEDAKRKAEYDNSKVIIIRRKSKVSNRVYVLRK